MFENLIIDRTKADVDSGNKKGFYDYDDRNRVEQAVKDLSLILTENGYPTSVDTFLNWTLTTFPTNEKMTRYLANIKHLKKQLGLPEKMTTLPETMDFIGYEDANEIERTLLLIYNYLNKILEQKIYSGTIYSGEEW